jgi:hypothetical protein
LRRELKTSFLIYASYYGVGLLVAFSFALIRENLVYPSAGLRYAFASRTFPLASISLRCSNYARTLWWARRVPDPLGFKTSFLP